MTVGDLGAQLSLHVPGATARFAFSQHATPPYFDTPRIDILYTFANAQHTGLLHWIDEATWFEGKCFVVAMELSKFCRLAMKGHPHAARLMAADERLGQHDWPGPIGAPDDVASWLSRCNDWLFMLRGA